VKAGGQATFTDLATAIATSRQFRYRTASVPDTAAPPPTTAPAPVSTGTSAQATPR
jgi:hypothetical protein